MGPIMRRHQRKGEPTWSWRRSVIFPLVIFACFRLAYMEDAPDTRVNETIAWIWGVVIISCIFFYTGFASAQDIAAIMATRSGLPYADPPVSIDGQATDAAMDPAPPQGYAQ